MTAVAHAAAQEHRDRFGARLGMWLFLFTELILFGGLFLLYAVYRSGFSEDFHFAATTLDPLIGGVNTLILLTSSLTMALSIATLERHRRRLSVALIGATILMGLAFLVIKGFEWSAKIAHGLFPGSEELFERNPGENVFYGLYYGMTGLHALHVLVGLGVLAVMLALVARRPRRGATLGIEPGEALRMESAGRGVLWSRPAGDTACEVQITLVYEDEEDLIHEKASKLENAGLYWHLVDVIWIFLFPLFYLIS